jgi:hypothetical protein
MQLNHNSFSAKLYRWFYGVDSMPGNLCPYFWKLVIAYMMALPLFVSTLPYEIIYFKSRENDEKISNRIFVSFIICLFFWAAFCLLSVFSLIFGYRPVHESGMYYSIGTGILGWLIIIPIVSYHGIKYLIQKAKEPKRIYDEEGRLVIQGKRTKPNIVVEFVKAKYNKYCPKIEWKNETNNN